MALFEIFNARLSVGFVSADCLDEMHQSGSAIADIRGLVERIDHEPGNKLVAALHRRISMRSIILNLDDEVLRAKPLQHRPRRS